MADHFYSLASDGAAFSRDRGVVTVATTAQSANHMELRVTDGTVTKEQLREFVEFMSDLLSASDYLFTQNTPFIG